MVAAILPSLDVVAWEQPCPVKRDVLSSGNDSTPVPLFVDYGCQTYFDTHCPSTYLPRLQ